MSLTYSKHLIHSATIIILASQSHYQMSTCWYSLLRPRVDMSSHLEPFHLFLLSQEELLLTFCCLCSLQPLAG